MTTEIQETSGQSHSLALFFQVFALAIASLAIIWGAALIFTVAVPGSSGEWAAMGVLLAYMVDIPAGLIVMIIAMLTKRGNRTLRRICIIMAIICFILPMIVHVINRYHTQWKYNFAERHLFQQRFCS